MVYIKPPITGREALENARKNIKQLRKDKSLSWKDFAERAGINESTLKGYVYGKNNVEIPLTVLPDIAKALSCTPDRLLGYIDTSNHNIQFIRNETGLSESAINKLSTWVQSEDKRHNWPTYLSDILDQESIEQVFDLISFLEGSKHVYLLANQRNLWAEEDNEKLFEENCAYLYQINLILNGIIKKLFGDYTTPERKRKNGKHQ